MASKLERDLSCPVCQDILKVPVLLSCNHSFCKDCLQNVWADRQNLECPLCKRRSSKECPSPNLALKKQCEAFLRVRGSDSAAAESRPLCSLHSETLDFLCLDDQQLVCSICCRDSETHGDHRFKPVDEAVGEHKKKLQDYLKPLQKKLRVIREIKGNCDQTAEHIKVQAEYTEKEIREEFKRLHQFLDEEEEARLAALREEEEQKSELMKEKIRALSTEMTALSETIGATERQLRVKDASFLQNYKAVVERVQQQPLPDDPELVSGALIDVARHLGNLRFNVWDKMKEMVSYSPVILDPNTAHPNLILSEDLTVVTKGQAKQEVPDNPERINHFFSVVGSEGFNSGSHSWDVEVRNNTAFVVGMLEGSLQRKGVIWFGLWRLMFCNGEYKCLSPSDTGTDVTVMRNPKRIRVHLDWDRGQLSFSDADTNAHIHSYTHTFTDRLFPYISTWSEVPIKIRSMKVSVAVEQHRDAATAEIKCSTHIFS
ncbi:nuclear factor 7, ovary-like [Lates calcarifer]|uniref:Nuclear factor 7, ovary-like n=1 Tax=Lates calcarifer TaxID=8187 RepID=A0A4W6D0T5_LATCA|nr:nuclear factor 7, ovary-like [Lates calcarifer]